MDVNYVVKLVENEGYVLIENKRMPNDKGTVIKLANGCIINCWDSGKINCQGKNTNEIEDILNGKKASIKSSKLKGKKKVFVLYGHDTNARTQLEAMLRRWDLEPLILDQLVSSGQTIIEKLEEYTSQVDFGIVLATPDDIGYAKGNESNKKYRVRQNVVMELGMLLASIGRSKTAILLSQAEDMEAPSDIQGLVYIPFKDNVEETKLSLAKELTNNGYHIDISKL